MADTSEVSAEPDDETEGFEASPEALAAAGAAIEQILALGGRLLAEIALHRCVIHNAWESTREVACSRLQMCFVPHEETSAGEGLLKLEEEPPPPTKDIWGRKQIEVVRPRSEAPSVSSPRRGRRSSIVQGGRRSSVVMPDRNQQRRASWLAIRSRVMPLGDDLDVDLEDPDESARQLWSQRAAQRTSFVQRVHEAEVEAKSKEASLRFKELQVLSKENAEFCTESVAASTVKVCQSEDMARLPKMNDSMQFDIRSVKDSSSSAATIAESVDGSPEAKPGVRLKIAQEGRREAAPVSPPDNFIHGFEKTEGCQPSPLQTMCMQPGVVLECDGRKKYGPRPRRDRMAWKDYNGEGQVMFDVYWDMGDLYDQTAGTEVVTSTESPTAKELAAMVARPSTTNLEASQPCSNDSAKARPASALQAELRARLGRFEGLKRPASANLLGVRGESLFSTSKSAAAVVTAAVCWLGQGTRSGVPADSKVQGLKAPAALQQSSKQLADAPRPQRITRSASCSTGIAQVSVLRSQPRKPRQKVVLIGGRGLVVQPPLGATMGHGLLPNESNLREAVRKGEFYYPSPTSAKGEHQPRRTASPCKHSVSDGQKMASRAWR